SPWLGIPLESLRSIIPFTDTDLGREWPVSAQADTQPKAPSEGLQSFVLRYLFLNDCLTFSSRFPLALQQFQRDAQRLFRIEVGVLAFAHIPALDHRDVVPLQEVHAPLHPFHPERQVMDAFPVPVQ